jgi:CheY-like chemotaxis protein
VDDNLDAAQSLAEVLRSYGHDASAAPGPAAALAAAAERWPDVFILDIGLPDMDGYELAGRLRALPAARPALYLALTGYGQPQDRQRSRAAGFQHHFVKPIDLPGLAGLLAGLP